MSESNSINSKPPGLWWPQEEKTIKKEDVSTTLPPPPAGDKLKWLTPEERELVINAQNAQTEEMSDLYVADANYEAELDDYTDKVLNGEMTPEEVKKKMETGVDFSRFGDVAVGVGKKFLQRAEEPLGPARAEFAKQNVPYVEPTALGQMFAKAATAATMRQAINPFKETGPGERILETQPRKARLKSLSTPVFDEDGRVNIEPLLRSGADRGKVNTIAIKQISRDTGIPQNKLSFIVKMRMGELADDSTTEAVFKNVGQTLDGILFRIPSMLTTKFGKSLHDEFAQMLVRPKGEKFFDDATLQNVITPAMKNIKNGKTSTLSVNGMNIDVNPDDTADTIQDKAYRTWMKSMLAQVENLATSPLADAAGMVLPLEQLAQLGKAVKGLSAVDDFGKAVKVMNKTPHMTSIIYNPLLEKVAPNVAKKLQNSAVARVGDWTVTTLAAAPTLAAIGAPAGTEKETAAGVLGITAPLAIGPAAVVAPAYGVSKVYGGLVRGVGGLKDVALIRSIKNADSLKDMSRYHQRKFKSMFPADPELSFKSAKAAQNMNDFVKREISNEAKARLNNVDPNSFEFARALARDPDFVGRIDAFVKEATMGKALTSKGRAAQQVLNRYLEELNIERADIRKQMSTNAMTPSLGQMELGKLSFKERFLKDIIHDKRNLLENWDDLVTYLDKESSPLAKQIANQLQNEDVSELVFDDIQHLIGGKYSKDLSVDEYVKLLRNGVIARDNPHDQLLMSLFDNIERDKMNDRESVNVEGTLIRILSSDANIVDAVKSINTIQGIVTKIEDLNRAKNVDFKHVKSLKEDLKKELVKIAPIAREKSKAVDTIKSDIYQVKRNTNGSVKAFLALKSPFENMNKTVADVSSFMNKGMNIPEHVKQDLSRIVGSFKRGAPEHTNLIEIYNGVRSYEAKKKTLTLKQMDYDNYVDKYFDVLHADEAMIKSLPDDLLEVFEAREGQSEEVKYRAVQRFIRDLNPHMHNLLTKSEDFNNILHTISTEIAEGRRAPDNEMVQLTKWVNDDAEFKKLAKGSHKEITKLINPDDVREYIRSVSDAYKSINDVFFEAKNIIASVEEALKDETADVATMTRQIAYLKDNFNYASLRRQLKALDERVFEHFEKKLKGSDLKRQERRRLYNFLSGNLMQRIAKYIQPDWLVTNRAYAEGYFKARQFHSAELMNSLAKKYNETFGSELDSVAFTSIFLNAQTIHGVNEEMVLITEMSRYRRSRQVDRNLIASLGLNQEALTELMQDKSMIALSDSLESLGAEKMRAKTVASNFLLDHLFNPLQAIKHNGYRFYDLLGKKSFVEKFKRFMGVAGFQEWTHITDANGKSSLTKFGEILYEWKTLYPNLPIDYVLSQPKYGGPNWRSDTLLKKWGENLATYWSDSEITDMTIAEYKVLFDAMNIVKELDYKKLEVVNQIIRDGNARNKTNYAEFTHLPERLMMVRDKSLVNTFENPALIDRNSYDTAFGRHISSSREGQIHKIQEVMMDNAAHPWQVIIGDTLHMVEHGYTNHYRKQLNNAAIRLNNLGYYSESMSLERTLGMDKSNATISLQSLPNKVMMSMYSIPGIGHGIALLRASLGSRVILSRPKSLLYNAVNGATFAAMNPREFFKAVRILLSYPALLANRAFMATDATTKQMQGFGEIRTLTPELRGDVVGTEKFLRAVTLEIGEPTTIGQRIIEEALAREQNASNQARFNYFATTYKLNSWKPVQRTLMAVNTVSDIIVDGTGRYLKESMELSQAKAAYTDSMLIWQKAVDMAKVNPDVNSVAKMLIGNMSGLRNQAPFYKLAQQLVENVNDRPYMGSLEYITMYKNHLLGRFDPSNVPTFVKNLSMIIPGAGQFYNALTNHMYRAFTMSRRLATRIPDNNHRMLATLTMSSIILQSMMFAWMKDGIGSDQEDDGSLWSRGIGLDGERLAAMPTIVTAIKAMIGNKEVNWNVMNAKLDIGGMEYANYIKAATLLARAVMAGSNADDKYSQVKQDLLMRNFMDHAIKMSPAAIFLDFVESPATMSFMMMSDTNDYIMQAAIRNAMQSEIDIEIFQKLGKIVRATTGAGGYEWWKNTDEMLTYMGAMGFSPAPQQLMEMSKRFQAKQYHIEKLSGGLQDESKVQLYNLLLQEFAMRELNKFYLGDTPVE